ncbi:MAG: hypothetical protein MJY45_01295 [Bacteroidales bacterium]|nr:hypothetical protein [Bacteroidales bacterium]
MVTEDIFPLDSEKVYDSQDELTLDTPDGLRTLKIGAWLNEDPVRIHKLIIREKTLHVNQIEVFNPLISKLRRADPDYYMKVMGLQLLIDFPGYGTGIKAKIPFENDPVGFYKWWRREKHENKVHLSTGYRIILFQKVLSMSPKTLLKKDKDFLNQ